MKFEEWASKNLKDRYLRLIKRIRDEKLAGKSTVGRSSTARWA
jgi:hypothetical protein